VPKRVLAVDDHAPTRRLIRAVIEGEKYDTFDVEEAANGDECLEAVRAKGPFDLILLDVTLPDTDGYSLCRSVREVDSRVPIVFVTAKGELEDFASGREAGGDSYLVKPIARSSLRSIVRLFTSIERRNKASTPPPEG
jgi:DNA-binding response OmpR family regulator